jgi:antitoxin FitA
MRLISDASVDIIDIEMAKEKSTSSVTIRNIPAETHRALRVRAARHGRSTEAEIRLILEAAAKPEGRIRLGSLLTQIGHEAGGVDLRIERDATPAVPVTLDDSARHKRHLRAPQAKR